MKETSNSKIQTSEKVQISTLNPMGPRHGIAASNLPAGMARGFEFWNLKFPWSLIFGFWIFTPAPFLTAKNAESAKMKGGFLSALVAFSAVNPFSPHPYATEL